MTKKRATKAATTASNALTKLANPNGEKTIGQLPKAEREKLLAEMAGSITAILDAPRRQFEEMFAAWERRDTVEIPDWLESLGLPRDITLAAQVALAEYGEFATADDIDDCTHSVVIELIKVVSAKKEWDRKLASQSNPQSSGWPTLSPDDLRKLFEIKQDALVRRLNSQAIPNQKITTKAYRVDPSALPEDWKRIIKRK